MMAIRGDQTLLLALIWTTCSSFTLGTDGLKARIRVKRENGAFLSFTTSKGHMLDKLVQAPSSRNVYAGGPQGLYMLNPGDSTLQEVSVPIFEPGCQGSSAGCGYNISLLKEGKNKNPLFMCGTREKNTVCCDVNSEHHPTNSFKLNSRALQITEPSMHVDDALYYTVSTRDEEQPGFYRWNHQGQHKFTWPLTGTTEQRYVKVFGNQSSGSPDGKVYVFYTERNQNQDTEAPLWIPRVSQICTADCGGSKSVLQYRWTSMLTARLFCGEEKKHLTYTELLDVAVLEAAEWENTTIYGLFKNAYNSRAVCVYKMSDVIRGFASNSFKDSAEEFSSPRPGECVENSQTLSPNFLKFMEKRPEMSEWIEPARGPLMLMHHHYTHLQVDRVEDRKSENGHHVVLFMALENGKVHKILEQKGESFVITEYETFKSRISSMLLDRDAKKLTVSSHTEVIQIDLHNCTMYAEHCDSCVMARDPYCGWDVQRTKCAAHKEFMIQDVTHGNLSTCENNVPKHSLVQTPDMRVHAIRVSRDSKFFLKCPVESLHASYAWEHQGRRKECRDVTDQDCLLLIDSMSENHEGVYKCVASEKGHDRTVVRHELQMNAAAETRATNVAVACILFLIAVIC